MFNLKKILKIKPEDHRNAEKEMHYFIKSKGGSHRPISPFDRIRYKRKKLKPDKIEVVARVRNT